MDFDFNKFFKYSVYSMQFNRSHPEIRRDAKWLLQFFLMHGVFTVVFLLIIYSTVFHEIMEIKDMTRACANSVIAVLYTIVSFCYAVMLHRQNSFMFMINKMQSDYLVAKTLSKEEQALLLKYVKRGKSNIILWFGVTAGVAGLFVFKSMFLMMYYAVIGEFRLVPVYELKYPPILEVGRDSFGSFICLYTFMVWYCVYATSMYIGLTPLGAIFMLHACGQLELVKRRIETLFPHQGYNVIETRKKVREIIIHLQDIYSFVEHININFLWIYEMSLKGTTISLPLLIYEILEKFKNNEISMEFITITIGSIALSSCPCYFSDLLMETGDNMRQAMYSSGWETHWDRRTRTSLLIIMTRTVQPVAVRSMFGNLCLVALTDVFQQAYGIFNLLNALW